MTRLVLRICGLILLGLSSVIWGRDLQVVPLVNATGQKEAGRSWLLEPRSPGSWWPLGSHMAGTTANYLYLLDQTVPERPVIQSAYLFPGEVEAVVPWPGGLLAWVHAPEAGAADATWMYRILWDKAGELTLLGPEPWREGVLVEAAACSQGKVCFLDGGGESPTAFLVEPGPNGWPSMKGRVTYGKRCHHVVFQGDRTYLWAPSESRGAAAHDGALSGTRYEGVEIHWDTHPASTRPLDFLVNKGDPLPASVLGPIVEGLQVGYSSVRYDEPKGFFYPLHGVSLEDQVTSFLTWQQKALVSWSSLNEAAQRAFQPDPDPCSANASAREDAGEDRWHLLGSFGEQALFLNDRGEEKFVPMSRLYGRPNEHYAFGAPYLFCDEWSGLYMIDVSALPADTGMTEWDRSLAGSFLLIAGRFGLALANGSGWMSFRLNGSHPENVQIQGDQFDRLLGLHQGWTLELHGENVTLYAKWNEAFALWRDPEEGLFPLGPIKIEGRAQGNPKVLAIEVKGGRALPGDRFFVWGTTGADQSDYAEAVLDFTQPFMPTVSEFKVADALRLSGLFHKAAGDNWLATPDGFLYRRMLSQEGQWPRVLLGPAGLVLTIPRDYCPALPPG